MSQNPDIAAVKAKIRKARADHRFEDLNALLIQNIEIILSIFDSHDKLEAERDQLRERVKKLEGARYGRCREFGGGMLMVFAWFDTPEEAAAAIAADSPITQFVIAKLAALNLEKEASHEPKS